MSAEACRIAITTTMQAALALYPSPQPIVQYDNRSLVDTTTQVDPFVCLEIVNINGHQLELGANGLRVQYGQIIIMAVCKENSGTKEANTLLDYFLPYFENKELGIVRTHAGMYSKAKLSKGWQAYPVTVPFWWTR